MLKTVLLWTAALSFGGFASILVIRSVLAGRSFRSRDGSQITLESPVPDKRKLRLKSIGVILLQYAYQQLLRIPLLRGYTLMVRRRLSFGVNQDEYRIRLRTSAAVCGLIGIFISGITILFSLNPDFIYLLTLLLTTAVMNGLLLETYATRLQRMLLLQTSDMFTGIRHAYHRHGIADEAIKEAADEAGREVSQHGYRIYEALNAPDPQRSLETYYETSPGRFLKTFAGVSFLVSEYGDKASGMGSLFLKALSELTKEIHLELLRLTKLDYLLKGLHVIAIAPIFFTKPIERWARGNFPLMDVFYAGKYGMLTKICIYVTIFVCYVLLQKLKSEDEFKAAAKPSNWEKRLYELKVTRILVAPFLPLPRSQHYIRSAALLKDTFSKMRVEWFYVRRLVYFVLSFAAALSVFLVLHAHVRADILTAPNASTQLLFGVPDQEERRALITEAASDKAVMKELGMTDNLAYEEIASRVNRMSAEPKSKEKLNEDVTRIAEKLSRWNSEILKGWEVAAAVGFAFCAYYAPYWLLLLQRRLRLMEMKHEIYQFYTLILILREMDRMSVEEILEWLNSFAVIFKTPLEKCLLHFEHGQEAALETMKSEVSLPEFQRLADKLLLSVSQISLKRAFDDVDSEMGYFFEQRKLDYEKTLETKANLGKMIGFTPMYALIFMYLVIPLIWMSFSQMTVYYEQIQKL